MGYTWKKVGPATGRARADDAASDTRVIHPGSSNTGRVTGADAPLVSDAGLPQAGATANISNGDVIHSKVWDPALNARPMPKPGAPIGRDIHNITWADLTRPRLMNPNLKPVSDGRGDQEWVARGLAALKARKDAGVQNGTPYPMPEPKPTGAGKVQGTNIDPGIAPPQLRNVPPSGEKSGGGQGQPPAYGGSTIGAPGGRGGAK